MRLLTLAACLLAAPPGAALAAPAGETAIEETRDDGAKSPKKEDFDFSQIIKMFDNLFPPGPDPDPARLALAKTTAQGVFPNGTYAALFDDAMSGIVDKVLSMRPGELFPVKDGAKAATNASLREELTRDDPHFEERMKIMRKIVGEELIKISALMEPKLRDGLARSIARRLDEKQLKDVNAFLATDSGKAFAGQSMRMWVDPDVMRSMMQSMPHIVMAMPGAMLRLEAETAHLPKPKKKEEAKKAAAKK
jgi:hypothetical protein